MPRRLLFVCLGNICRSPTAEAVARQIAAVRGLDLEVDSAGTGAWHIGDAPDPRMQAAARRAGYEMANLQARQVTAEDFNLFDLILAMDRRNMAELVGLRPAGVETPIALLLPYGPTRQTEVPDPYYDGGFDKVAVMIEAAVEGLLDRVG